jgi:hypothetical protein
MPHKLPSISLKLSRPRAFRISTHQTGTSGTIQAKNTFLALPKEGVAKKSRREQRCKMSSVRSISLARAKNSGVQHWLV